MNYLWKIENASLSLKQLWTDIFQDEIWRSRKQSMFGMTKYHYENDPHFTFHYGIWLPFKRCYGTLKCLKFPLFNVCHFVTPLRHSLGWSSYPSGCYGNGTKHLNSAFKPTQQQLQCLIEKGFSSGISNECFTNTDL